MPTDGRLCFAPREAWIGAPRRRECFRGPVWPATHSVSVRYVIVGDQSDIRSLTAADRAGMTSRGQASGGCYAWPLITPVIQPVAVAVAPCAVAR